MDAARDSCFHITSKSAGTFLDCYRFRADALDRRGDWAGAQRAYAAAVALAPDLPAGYYSWGLALARHADFTNAERKLRAAHERGPSWADPLKSLGDVLAAQKRWRAAIEQYDEALKLAPEWPALKLRAKLQGEGSATDPSLVVTGLPRQAV